MATMTTSQILFTIYEKSKKLKSKKAIIYICNLLLQYSPKMPIKESTEIFDKYYMLVSAEKMERDTEDLIIYYLKEMKRRIFNKVDRRVIKYRDFSLHDFKYEVKQLYLNKEKEIVDMYKNECEKIL